MVRGPQFEKRWFRQYRFSKKFRLLYNFFVKKCYEEFHDNPTNGLVADNWLQTEGRKDVVYVRAD